MSVISWKQAGGVFASVWGIFDHGLIMTALFSAILSNFAFNWQIWITSQDVRNSVIYYFVIEFDINSLHENVILFKNFCFDVLTARETTWSVITIRLLIIDYDTNIQNSQCSWGAVSHQRACWLCCPCIQSSGPLMLGC